MMIFLMGDKVLLEFGNSLRQQGNLDVRRARILLMGPKLPDHLLLLFRRNGHNVAGAYHEERTDVKKEINVIVSFSMQTVSGFEQRLYSIRKIGRDRRDDCEQSGRALPP